MDKKFEKPNNGALFAVKSKTNPMQPDYRGDIIIDLKTFEVVNNTIKVSLSGWKKPMSTGEFSFPYRHKSLMSKMNRNLTKGSKRFKMMTFPSNRLNER